MEFHTSARLGQMRATVDDHIKVIDIVEITRVFRTLTLGTPMILRIN